MIAQVFERTKNRRIRRGLVVAFLCGLLVFPLVLFAAFAALLRESVES